MATKKTTKAAPVKKAAPAKKAAVLKKLVLKIANLKSVIPSSLKQAEAIAWAMTLPENKKLCLRFTLRAMIIMKSV